MENPKTLSGYQKTKTAKTLEGQNIRIFRRHLDGSDDILHTCYEFLFSYSYRTWGSGKG